MKQNLKERCDKQTPRTIRILQLCLLFLLVTAAGTGCKQNGKAATDTKSVSASVSDINPVGTYSLAKVDGQQVPCTMTHEGHTMTINSGSFTINADGTCSSKISLAGREAALEVAAQYTREDSKLTMKWAGAGVTIGTVEGGTFTMTNEGMVFVYRK